MPPRLLRDAPSEPTSLANLLGQRGQAEARTVLAQRQPWTQAITQAGQGAAQTLASAMEQQRQAPMQALKMAKEVEDLRTAQQTREIESEDQIRAARSRSATQAGDMLNAMRGADTETQKKLYGRFLSKLEGTGMSGLEPPEETEFGTPEFYRYATWMRNNLNEAYAPDPADRTETMKSQWEEELGRDLNMEELQELKYKVDPLLPKQVLGVLNGKPAWAMLDERTGQFTLPNGQNVTDQFTPPEGRPGGDELQGDVDAYCKGVAAGTMPPHMKGHRWSGDNVVRLNGCLSQQVDPDTGEPFNMAKTVLRWEATSKQIQTLNGPQQTRLRQIGSSLIQSIQYTRGLVGAYEQLRTVNTALPALNQVTVKMAMAGVLGPQARDIVTELEAYITDIHTELSTMYRSGHAPTDSSLEKAEKNLQVWWSIPTMIKGLDMIERQMEFRLNAINMTPPTMGGGTWAKDEDGTYAPDFGNAAWQKDAIRTGVPQDVKDEIGGHDVAGDTTYQFEDGSYWHKADNGDIMQVPAHLANKQEGSYQGVGVLNGREYNTAGFTLVNDALFNDETAYNQAIAAYQAATGGQ
tara:strand:- start:21581 stop:23317 length:1737 start_codon:yes stop_codon:yes gene_type:complete